MGLMHTSIHIQENFLHRESNLTFASLLIAVSSSRDYIITPFHEVLTKKFSAIPNFGAQRFLEDVLCHVLSIISQVLTSINFNLPNRFDRVMSNRGLKIIRKCKKVFD